jgi:phage-related protein
MMRPRYSRVLVVLACSVYTVKFAEAVFVLHCFQKKSKSGIATPKTDMDIIRARLKVAEALAQELKNAKTHH